MGLSPSEGDIAAFFGVAGSSAHQMVVTLEKKGALRRIGGVARSIQVLVDAAAVVHRFRRDSDHFRGLINYIGGTNDLLKGIKTELNHMNGMLAAIPPMGHEVHLMNRQMSVMTYSMGSTMGRMGSIIPW